MTDLHGWITQQITHAETVANAATPGPWHVTKYNWHTDFAAGIGTSPGDVDIVGHGYEGGGVEDLTDAEHIALHNPAAVLRRCTADRKILSDHTSFGDGSLHCVGCGIDYETGPLVDNVNDCPTLLSLAEGYGLTEEQRAQLDRPEPAQVRSQPRGPMPDTSRVPPTFRGPNWRPTRKEQA